MPEPVTCHAPKPGSNIIECDDVPIGPEPPEPQQVEVHEGGPGARALVRSQTAPLIHYDRNPTETIDTPYTEIGKRCVPEVIAGVAVIGGSTRLHPVLGALTAVKTGIEISQCVAETVYDAQLEANQERAIENCVTTGGTPVGIVDNILTCERTVQVTR